MMVATSVVLGVLIGLVMGALGGGGSVLTVPALVFALGLSAQAATTGSLVIVGITSAVAAVGHAWSRHVDWRSGLLLAAVGVPASLLGTGLNRHVAEDVLLLSFAGLMVVAAVGMLVRPARGEAEGRCVDPDVPRGGIGRSFPILLGGLLIGFLTGFLGVGGGFVIVPVLVVGLRFRMPIAVGTSLLVIALNSAVALAARAGASSLDWGVVAPFTVAAVLASLAGERVARRAQGEALTRAFAVLLILVAGYVTLSVVA